MEIYNAMQGRHNGTRWTDYPVPPTEWDVWSWISRFQDEFLSDAPNVYSYTESSRDLTGGEAPRQLDLLVKRRDSALDGQHAWQDIRVAGEHRQSENPFKPLFLRLVKYMRDIFSVQPTRRFVHGFLLHGSTMELWVFDRSGPYKLGRV